MLRHGRLTRALPLLSPLLAPSRVLCMEASQYGPEVRINRAGGAPTSVPITNVWCIGRNYVEHAKELGNAVPTEEPVIFLKSSSAVRPLESGLLAFADETFHHEIELVLLVGKHVPLGALAVGQEVDCVSAVGLGLDLTRRGKQSELKKAGLPWTLAKSFCGGALLSPFTTVPTTDIAGISFKLNINGEVKQSGHVSQMIFDVPSILRYLNSFVPLLPGDLVFTGTPSGVGPVRQGDTLGLSFLTP